MIIEFLSPLEIHEDCENEFSSLLMEMKTHKTRFNPYESQRLDY